MVRVAGMVKIVGVGGFIKLTLGALPRNWVILQTILYGNSAWCMDQKSTTITIDKRNTCICEGVVLQAEMGHTLFIWVGLFYIVFGTLLAVPILIVG